MKVCERGPTAPALNFQHDSLLLNSRVANSVANRKYNPVSLTSSIESKVKG